jgi:hypothetical protein
MEILGSIGIGAVIGWLSGLLELPRRVFRQALTISAASVLVLLEIAWLAGWRAALAALISGLTVLFIHHLWRNDLRQRSSQ